MGTIKFKTSEELTDTTQSNLPNNEVVQDEIQTVIANENMTINE